MLRRTMLLVLALASEGLAETLAEKVDALVAASPVASRGHWGAQFIDLDSGEILYARNENSFFVPASNTKLFSTAAALIRLGPNYQQTTRLVASQPLESGGILRGDLRLVGAGDTTISGRILPYDPKAKTGDPLAGLDELAEQAWQAGLRRVEGDLVGDDSAYLWEPYPEGWAQDDTRFGYGAPVSAIILHDNTFSVRVEAGEEAGQPVRVTVNPSPGYWTLESRVRTGVPATGVKLEREPGSRQVELWGTIAPRRAVTLSLAVDDPARYAAFAMKEALERRGIVVAGNPAAWHRHPVMGLQAEPDSGDASPDPDVEFARRASPPLIETLKVINKVSQNLQAEAVLLELARTRGRVPGRAGAVEELKDFLEAAGIPADDYHFEDGSGLSRLTLITPATTVRLLRYMHGSPMAAHYRSLMPRGGFDGTLEKRFKRFKGASILAKTGSLSHTAALGGYVERPGKPLVAFSVMVNNANARGAAMQDFIDKLVASVLE